MKSAEINTSRHQPRTNEIKAEAQDYLILREDEIIGIFTQAGKAVGKR